MPAHVCDDEEITRRRAQPTAFAFRRYAHARSGIDAGRDAHLNSLCFWDYAFAFAKRARRASLAGATTVWTLLRKTQTAAGSLHLSRTFARRTDHHRPTG